MKIVLVCLGNICRSPLAEVIMKHYLKQDSFLKEKQIIVRSAGVSPSALHKKMADPRVKKIAELNQMNLDHHQSTYFTVEDLNIYDYILVMDYSNKERIGKLDSEGKYAEKIKLFSEFSSRKLSEIKDPYFSNVEETFSELFDIMTDCCKNFLVFLKSTYGV